MRMIPTTLLLVLAGLAPALTAGDDLHPIAAPPITIVSLPAAQIAAGDVNGDGHLDVVTSAGVAEPSVVSLGDGAGGFTPVDLLSGGLSAVRPLLRDVTGDGVLDLLVSLNGGNRVEYRVGVGDGSFGPAITLFDSAPSTRLAVADVDGDGDLDVLVPAWSQINDQHDGIHHLLNDGSGGFTAGPLLGLANPLTDFEVSDLNGDGWLDLVLFEPWPWARLLVHLSLGGGAYGSPTVVHSWPQNTPTELHVGDVDGDGDQDLVMFVPGVAEVQVFENRGDGDFAFVAPWSVDLPTQMRSMLLVDMQGDSARELVLASSEVGEVWVLSGSDFGTATLVLDALGGPTLRSAGDVDADGRLDLLIGNSVENGTSQTLLNRSYASAGPFTNLALGGLAGTALGTPVLVVSGAPVVGQQLSLSTSKAPAATPTWFVLGAELLASPFKGGLLVPSPTLLVGPLPADGDGATSVSATWPGGLSGLELWVQGWLQDGSGPAGFTATPTTHVLAP